mgnify:FL=1
MKDEDRLTILKIKYDMVEKTEHGREISGVDVYRSVLEGGAKDLEGFREYLKKQGREL